MNGKRWRCCSGLRPTRWRDGSFQVVVDQEVLEWQLLRRQLHLPVSRGMRRNWPVRLVATTCRRGLFEEVEERLRVILLPPSSDPACGWAGPGLLDSHRPEPPGPSSSGTARGPPAGSGRGHRIFLILVCPHVHQRFVMFLVESRERLNDIRKWRSRW